MQEMAYTSQSKAWLPQIRCWIYAAVNGYIEFILKGLQRFNAISTLNHINFGISESSPDLFLNMMNLNLVKFEVRWILNERALYCFIILFESESLPRKNKSA